MLDRLVGLLGVGDTVDNGTVDNVGRFDTRTDCSFPINRIRNIECVRSVLQIHTLYVCTYLQQ